MTRRWRLSPGAIVGVVVLIIFAIIFSTMTICFLRRKAKKHNLNMESAGDTNGNEILEAESLQYDLNYIKVATSNFSAENKIGEGGFGEVSKVLLIMASK